MAPTQPQLIRKNQMSFGANFSFLYGGMFEGISGEGRLLLRGYKIPTMWKRYKRGVSMFYMY